MKAFHFCRFCFRCEIGSQRPQITERDHNRQGHSHPFSEWERACFDPLVDPHAPDSWHLRPPLTVLRPTSVSGRVVFGMVLKSIFRTHKTNQRTPFNLPFVAGFHFSDGTTIFPFRKSRNRKNKSVHSISVWETVIEMIEKTLKQ